VLQKQPFIRFVLLDSSESSSLLRFNIRRGTTVAAAAVGANDMRSRVGPLTGARFTQQSVIYSSVEPEPGSPLPESIASRVGVFVFSCGLDQYAIVEIYGIREEFIDIENPCGGMLITLTHPVIAAFIEYMISGIFVNRFGHPLESLEAAFVQIRP